MLYMRYVSLIQLKYNYAIWFELFDTDILTIGGKSWV